MLHGFGIDVSKLWSFDLPVDAAVAILKHYPDEIEKALEKRRSNSWLWRELQQELRPFIENIPIDLTNGQGVNVKAKFKEKFL